jgi:hypothetical protein
MPLLGGSLSIMGVSILVSDTIHHKDQEGMKPPTIAHR